VLTVGVVAVQGDFAKHVALLKKLNVSTREVRLPKDLEGLDAIIMPGGESTTFRHLFDLYGLAEPITALASSGVPIWGTCAGMIMMASELEDHRPKPLGLMDVTVSRNAYGRQVDSFVIDINFPILGEEPFHTVFIRAPAATRIGPGVEVLGALPDGTPVALRQGNLLVTSFHPELTRDTRFHQYFLSLLDPSP
jgi:5'-phosphate synthase pdxT subunit